MIAELDSTRFSEVMKDLHDALMGAGQEGDAQALVIDEGRRLLKQIIRFTPPVSQPQGEMAIQRELNSMISEANQSTIDDIATEFGTENVDTWRRLNSGELRRLRWDHMLTSENENRLRQLHFSYKNRRGKVGKRKPVEGEWRARVVVPKGCKPTYIDRVKANVGRWKASWCALAERMGVRVEPWVSRHLPSPRAIGKMEMDFFTSTPMVIEMGSRAPGVMRQEHIIANAVRVRGEAMARRAGLIISGYNKDLARGMKIKAGEAKRITGDENEYGSSGVSYY